MNIITSLILVLIPSVLLSQHTINDSELYNWFDDFVGYESLGLENGKQYVDEFVGKSIDNTNVFFFSNKMEKVSLTYNGNTFYDLNLKYDLYNDQLILQSQKGKGVILLIKEKISNFRLNDAYFINLNAKYPNGKIINGFHELVYENKFVKLYKQHAKTKKEFFVGNKIKYKFNLKTKFILFKGEFIDVNSKSQLIKVFAKDKKYIKNYYRKNISLKKNQPDTFMKSMLLELISFNNF